MGLEDAAVANGAMVGSIGFPNVTHFTVPKFGQIDNWPNFEKFCENSKF